MVSSKEKHRASIGAYGGRMFSKNWKIGFKKKGVQERVRSYSGNCPSHHLLFVVIAVMISMAMQNTEDHGNTKQGKNAAGNF